MRIEIAAELGPARTARSRASLCASGSPGYTLVELMMMLALVGILASVAFAKYLGYVEKARVARAIAEIVSISRSIDALLSDETVQMPDSLADVGAEDMLDPWGRPYRYLKLLGELPRGMSGDGAELPAVAAPGGGGGGPPGGGGGGGGPPGGGGGGTPAIALARKDRFLVPINSDYDLYSLGADGESKPQLNNAVSQDDVIRARDGSYVGLAENF